MVKKILILMILSVFAITVNAQLGEAQEKYNLAATAVNDGNTKEAIDLFNEAIELLADVEEDEVAEELLYNAEGFLPGLYLSYAKETAEAGETDEAIELFSKTIEVSEMYGDNGTKENAEKALPRLYYKKAAGLYKASAFDQAIVELDKAIEVDASFAKAYYLKAVVYKKTGDDVKLEEAAKQTIANAGNDNKTKAKAQKLAAGHFLKKGNAAKGEAKYDEAIALIQKSLEFNDNNGTAYLLLLQSYVAQEDWDNAIATANSAIELESDEEKKAGFYYEMANAYVGKGDNTSACDSFRKAAVGKYEANAKYQLEHVLKCQ
jgi:tetratricopeptide (TPR) repeat protein